MKARIISALIYLFLLPSISLAQGSGHGIEVRLTSQKLIEIEPGKIVTGSYLVSNKMGREIELLESLDLPTVPEGWQSIIAYERLIKLGVNEQKVRLVTFMVPRNCPTGKYEITYSLTDQRRAEIKATETFFVVVLPVVKIDAIVENKPEVVIAGEKYEVCLRLVNKGNSMTSMRLEAKGSPDYQVVVDPNVTILKAGSSKLINLFVATDAELRSRTNHVLEINAQAEAQEYGVVSVKRTVFVEILPKLVAVIDPRHKVPSQVRFIAVGNQDKEGFQMEYSGSGSLDEGGTRKVDFLFRGPDVKDRSVYGTRDVLSLNYSGKNLSLLLGDRLYSISPLAERLTYGRGAETSFHSGGLEIGSFYMETRWDEPKEKEIGAYARYKLNDKLNIKLNFLNKRKDASLSISAYEANIYTIQTIIEPSSTFNLGLEYGHSFNKRESESEDLAHRVTLDGEVSKRVWYTFENTYAGSTFLGYYNDVLYSNGTVAVSIYRNLRGNFSYRIYENNLDLDPVKSIAPREQSYRGVLSYPFAFGTSVSLDYEVLSRKDELSPAQFDYDENIWRLGLGQSFNKFSLQTYTEMVTFQNKLISDTDKTLERYRIYAYFHPSAKQSYSLFTRIGHNSFTGDPVRTTSIGASASFQVKNILSMGLSYQKNNLNNEKLPQQDYFISTIDFKLPNNHFVSLKVRWFKFEYIDKEDYSFFAAYTIPINISAMKKKSFGVIKGRVINRDEAGIHPLQDIVLTVDGLSTVTNQRGEFIFPSLKPGTYSLKVDQKSMGLKKITTEPIPISIEVQGGEITFREIGVSTTCQVSGRVVLFALGTKKMFGDRNNVLKKELFITGTGEIKHGQCEKNELKEVGGLGQILVEISNGEDILHQRTDEKGRFSFKGIRPGKWQVKVHNQGLPRYHYIEKSNFEVELKKGVAKEITINVLPRLRSIHILENGEITRGKQ